MRISPASLTLCSVLAGLRCAQPPDAARDAEQAEFLRKAELVQSNRLRQGVTKSRRATLRRGALVHVAIGLFWPIAAGMAQLPIIVTGAPYRAGAFSVLYVGGMIVVGLLVSTSALVALIKKNL